MMIETYRSQKAPFSKCYHVHTKTQSNNVKFLQFKERFSKLRFRDGLVWTVDLTVKMKLRFRDGLVWTVGLTVEIKLRFRGGLV